MTKRFFVVCSQPDYNAISVLCVSESEPSVRGPENGRLFLVMKRGNDDSIYVMWKNGSSSRRGIDIKVGETAEYEGATFWVYKEYAKASLKAVELIRQEE